jgi:hypothetical protein
MSSNNRTIDELRYLGPKGQCVSHTQLWDIGVMQTSAGQLRRFPADNGKMYLRISQYDCGSLLRVRIEECHFSYHNFSPVYKLLLSLVFLHIHYWRYLDIWQRNTLEQNIKTPTTSSTTRCNPVGKWVEPCHLIGNRPRRVAKKSLSPANLDAAQSLGLKL